jgi:hypothetical protein
MRFLDFSLFIADLSEYAKKYANLKFEYSRRFQSFFADIRRQITKTFPFQLTWFIFVSRKDVSPGLVEVAA